MRATSAIITSWSCVQVADSVLRGDFDENSDVDILAELEPGHIPGLFALAAMERELAATIGRTVDLRTYYDLSRYFRDDVVASARVVYAA